MIKPTTGNILHADVEAIINTVNCVGVMGRGIALQFKKAYPDNFIAYKKACDLQEVIPGKMFVFETGYNINPKYIINFPTKRHWKGNSKIEDIEIGLVALVKEIQTRNIRSIAIPPLGAGLGGLDWNIVKKIIVQSLSSIENEVDVYIYEPQGAPENDRMVKSQKTPNMTEGRAILITLINRYLKGLLDPYITLLEIHKLMYFVQESGQPLRLKYVKGDYGPYAENLRHVLHAIEGHYIIGYSDGGDNPKKEIQLIPQAVKDAETYLNNNQKILDRFLRVTELINGFESSDGMELLATAHWLKTKEKTEDLTSGFYNWNYKKQRYSERQIQIAENTLKTNHWL